MNRGYRYTARTERGQVIDGFVEAANLAAAHIKLKKLGLKPVKLLFDLGFTVRTLTSSTFDPGQLARLYTTLGRRIKNGKSIVDGLAAASEYLTDPRLKQATVTMRQAIQEGQSEYQAMVAAGFPRRDCMVIRSTVEAGKVGETFLNLAQDLTRSHGLRRSIKQVFIMPIAMSIFMYAFFFFAIWKIAPATMNFLKQTNLKMKLNPFIQTYFDFAAWFNENFFLGTLMYAAVPVGLFMLVRSGLLKRVIDMLPMVKRLSVKGDHATLWNSFALLYEAALPMRETCTILADAAARPDSAASFRRLAKRIDAGQSLEDAIRGCAFPDFVVGGVRSATSGGDLYAGLQDMVRNLEEDVVSATEALKEQVKTASIFVMALGILVTAAVSYFPVAGTVLSNV